MTDFEIFMKLLVSNPHIDGELKKVVAATQRMIVERDKKAAADHRRAIDELHGPAGQD